MNRHFAPMIGLVAEPCAPALAHAQTNLDQGKSASQIFASACVECHKAAHGLAQGQEQRRSDGLPARALHDQPRPGGRACGLRAGWQRRRVAVGGAPQGQGQKPTTEQAGVSTAEAKQANRCRSRSQNRGRQAGSPSRGGRPMRKQSRKRCRRVNSRISNAGAGSANAVADPPTEIGRKETKGQPIAGGRTGGRSCAYSGCGSARSNETPPRAKPGGYSGKRYDANQCSAGECRVRRECAGSTRQYSRLNNSSRSRSGCVRRQTLTFQAPRCLRFALPTAAPPQLPARRTLPPRSLRLPPPSALDAVA